MTDKTQKTTLIVVGLVVIIIIGLVFFPNYFSFYFVPAPNISDGTQQELNRALTNLGGPRIINDAIFNENVVLSAQTITQQSGIAPDQICMGINEVEGDGFELIGSADSIDGYTIQYTKNTNKKVKILVLCNVNAELLVKDIETYGYEHLIESSDCEAICKDTTHCCAIMLTNP